MCPWAQSMASFAGSSSKYRCRMVRSTKPPANNATFSISGIFNINSQTGGDFSGTSFLTVVSDQWIGTLSGQIDSGGNISGNFAAESSGDGILITGTFNGQLTGSTLTLNFDGQNIAGDTCQSVGTLVGNRS